MNNLPSQNNPTVTLQFKGEITVPAQFFERFFFQREWPHYPQVAPHAHAPSIRFTANTPEPTPEFCKLPSPKQRCPITGASRSWLIDQAEAGNIKLVRVLQPGKKRGAVFVHVSSLLAFLHGQTEK